MPKKTKKQKLRALERRRVEFKSTPTITQTPMTFERPNMTKPAEQKTVSYFFSDLKKSLFFIAIIIALEIILYFVRIKR